MQEFHVFLFYLCRCFDGELKDTKDFIASRKRQAQALTPEVEKELESMELYHTEIDWKMFVPPLPTHKVYFFWHTIFCVLFIIPIFLLGMGRGLVSHVWCPASPPSVDFCQNYQRHRWYNWLACKYKLMFLFSVIMFSFVKLSRNTLTIRFASIISSKAYPHSSEMDYFFIENTFFQPQSLLIGIENVNLKINGSVKSFLYLFKACLHRSSSNGSPKVERERPGFSNLDVIYKDIWWNNFYRFSCMSTKMLHSTIP